MGGCLRSVVGVLALGSLPFACGGATQAGANQNPIGNLDAGANPDAQSADTPDGAREATGTSPGDAAMTTDAGMGEAQAACVPRPPGIVSWWRGDGVFTDSVGHQDGFSAGGVTFAPGEVGQGFLLSGSADSYVDVPNSPTLEITGPMTIDAWILPTIVGGRILDKIQASTGIGYLLDTYPANLRMIVWADYYQSPMSLTAGAWMHVAGVYDGVSVTLYTNGAVVGVQPFSPQSPAMSLIPVRLGADSMGTSRFTGVLDEIRLFSRALSAAEIQAIYLQGSAPRCP